MAAHEVTKRSSTSARATRTLRRKHARRARRGSILFGAVVVVVGMAGILVATTLQSSVELRDARRSLEEVRAKQLADAAAERGMNFLQQAIRNTSVHDPLGGVSNLFAGGAQVDVFRGEPMLDGTAQVGAFSVRLTRLEETATSITVAIDATGYLPEAPDDLPENRRLDAWRSVRATVRYQLGPSEVFDYGYFLNNWGWFYGNTIYCNGNVRSNGQFDAAGYAPTITGQPLYDSVAWAGSTATLSGYQDDNGDGLLDGNDGGTFSSWDVVGAQNVVGNGGEEANQHEFQDQVPMPNLSDLSVYEGSAIAQSGRITIGGVEMCDAVLGDEAGEKQHLYLVGTAANPIVLDGPVVVRGDVLISGVVTGQGAIYSGGNVYCPKSITYRNGPATPRPASNTQAATEAWLSANGDKDFLGLFARENVVVGDFTDATWRTYVGWWLADDMNASAEDAGLDGIPHTRAGKDGVLGTADDDVLEGDGTFTIEHYTESDAALGLIPAGFDVGDPIPGTGEDIDGDGVYDPRITLADMDLAAALNTTNWAGNIPAAGVASYASISSIRANRLDAVFYTNHAFCWTVLGGSPAQINGALVSRNESIVYGTPSLSFNHDARLLGGASGRASNLLPSTIQPMEILRWTTHESDPLRAEVSP